MATRGEGVDAGVGESNAPSADLVEGGKLGRQERMRMLPTRRWTTGKRSSREVTPFKNMDLTP